MNLSPGNVLTASALVNMQDSQNYGNLAVRSGLRLAATTITIFTFWA